MLHSKYAVEHFQPHRKLAALKRNMPVFHHRNLGTVSETIEQYISQKFDSQLPEEL